MTTVRWLALSVSLALAAPESLRAAAAPRAPGPGEPAPRLVIGSVFDDADRNGRRDAGESGIEGALVSDLRDVAVTDAHGRFSLIAAPDAAVVFLSLPDGWASKDRFWRPLADAPPGATIDFALVRRAAGTTFTFLHASDTHLSQESLPRTRLLRALVEKVRPAFVLITGDLVRDALRVGETEARGEYELLASELAGFPVPVFAVPGNHDIFGIERTSSHVSPDHPLYGRAMCRQYVGPEYYSFNWGGFHFLGLDSVDYDDLWYYGHLDTAQLAWVRRDLARVPAATPIVTFNHIPFSSSVERLSGYTEDPPAPSLIRIGGRLQYRHLVSNFSDLLALTGSHPLELALGGHLHTREAIALETIAGRIRFHQTAAVVGPSEAPGLHFASGVTLYRAQDGHIDDGTFLPLDAAGPRANP